jgi:antitoxin FitA
MTNVLVRDLPDEVHAGLLRRANAAGQSLQQFLSNELTRLATTSSMSEVLARIADRSGGQVGIDTAVADLDAERESR